LLEEFKDIYGDIYVDERVSEDPPAGVQRIYAAMWDCMRGGGERQRERERERGRGGAGRGGEKQPFVKTTRQVHQNHSTSTAHQSIDTTKQEVMTEASIQKVYRSRMDSLDVVSVY
jgi:hypothetical protein